MLVAAVLRPEQGEDRELEMVRVTPEQLPDSGELPVSQTERTVEWLLCDCAQESSLARGDDVPSVVSRGGTRCR